MRKKDMRPYRPYGGRKKHPVLITVLCILLVLALAFAALQLVIGLHSRTQVAGGSDSPEVMVIFGCQVKPWGPSILLQDRLDTALAYLDAHPDLTVIVTGGKGDDEHQSEADCMHDYLRAHGFDGPIHKEYASRDTWQSVTYTKALMAREGLQPRSVLLVSNGFHLCRIRLLWDRAWDGAMTVSTLAAPSSHFPTAVKMFFREPLALVKSFLVDR